MTANPAGGAGTYTYQWQSSPDGSTWSNIVGATAVTCNPGAITATTHYRVQVDPTGTPDCGGVASSTNIVVIDIIPLVGKPIFESGDTSIRCQGPGTEIYTATAINTTGIIYELDNASLAGGNIINAVTGEVTYDPDWSGTSLITAIADGCNEPDSAIHTVIITPSVDIPVFTLGATSTRCQGDDTVTYSATANNSTSITYALDASSLTGGNTINDTTGEVYYNVNWSGTSTITASAAGCNGPQTEIHVVTINPSTTILQQSSDTSICHGSSAIFTVKATGTNITYQWSHDGVNLPGETANQLIINNADTLDAGIYRASLESDCSTTTLSNDMQLIIDLVNTSDIMGNIYPTCRATGETYSVTLSSGSDYQWSIPSESILVSDTTGLNTNSISLNFGTISGPIRVIEVNSLGCWGEEKTIDIILQGCDLVADFTVDKMTICPEDSIVFTDVSQGITPGTIYFWDFGEGAVPATATAQGPHKVVYSTPGLKTIQLIITQGLSDTLTRNDFITVNEIPTVSVADAERCGEGEVIFVATPFESNVVEFSINQGNTIAYTDNTLPYQYAVSIEHNATVDIWARPVNSVTGCIGTWDSTAVGISHPLPVTPPILVPVVTNVEEGYINVVCSGDEGVTYNVNPVSGSTYNWTIPALGYTRENASEVQVDWLIGRGEYTITVQEISAFGCEGTIRDTMVLVAQPAPDLGEDVNICAGQNATFSLPEEYQEYQWQDGSTLQNFSTSQAGIVYVTVMDKYGCQGSDTTLLTVHPIPSIELGSDTVICGENSVLLNAGEYELYQWSTGETINPVRVFSGVKTVFVTVTDRNGCQDSDTIKVLACNPLLLLEPITNTFTPNNDKVHDTWEIRNIQLFPDMSIKVYDRWGRLVFNVDKGYQNDWDGTFNGKDLPVDTYYFLIDLKMGDDPITGTVTIIR
jgi:gliding motility-associated-like protein